MNIDQMVDTRYEAASVVDTTASPSLLTVYAKRILFSNQPLMLYVTFAGLFITFSIASPVFLTLSNIRDIGQQSTLVLLIAVGLTFVLISGEIDLSVGSVLAISGVTAALAMQHITNNWLIGALVGIGTGAAAGAFNGILTTLVGIPSFLVTLGTLGIWQGIAYVVTGTRPVIIDQQTYSTIFSDGNVAGIPAAIVWSVVVVIIAIVVLHFGAFGRRVYATGGNVVAAALCGIRTTRIKSAALIISGLLAGLAAVVLTAQAHVARPDFGADLLLDVLAAVVIGGTSLFGGRGTIVGSVLGSLLIGMLNNGFVLLGVDPNLQPTIKGAIIIVAVAVSIGSRAGRG